MDTTFRIAITAALAEILGPLVTFNSSQVEAAGITETAVVAFSPETFTQPAPQQAPEALVFENSSPGQIDLATGAIETFEAADMDLPPLVIRFDMSGEQCHGHGGLFRQGTPATITICTESRPVVLHELAHAWEWTTLDDSARDEFVNAYGLETWNSKDTEWGDRGVEKFAETIAIGFILQSRSDNPTVIARLCLFEDITGQAHPALTEADCAA
jgi:hypothetical protein